MNKAQATQIDHATGPLEFTLTILDKGTNRISRDFKEQ